MLNHWKTLSLSLSLSRCEWWRGNKCLVTSNCIIIIFLFLWLLHAAIVTVISSPLNGLSNEAEVTNDNFRLSDFFTILWAPNTQLHLHDARWWIIELHHSTICSWEQSQQSSRQWKLKENKKKKKKRILMHTSWFDVHQLVLHFNHCPRYTHKP